MSIKAAKQSSERFTSESVRALVASNWEGDLPDRALEVLRAHEGKQLTRRILPKLPGGEAQWRVLQEFGSTYLETCSYSLGEQYRKPGDLAPLHLTIADVQTGAVVDCNTIVARNQAYFAGRYERNAKRLIAQNSAELCQRMADALNAVATANAALAQAESSLDALTDYDEPFSPEKYDFQKLLKGDTK